MRGLVECDDSLIVGPTLEPLDLEEVKKQRRFSPTTLDTLFDLWISAARLHFEEQTGRQLITATWERWLSEFPMQAAIELPHPPLQAVLSVAYDVDGVETILDPATYTVVAPQGDYARRGRIVLNSGAAWPTLAVSLPGSVRIQYTAGYGDAPGAISELARYALLMLVGHFHKFGEEMPEAKATIQNLPLGAKSVIDAFKYSALPQLPPLTSALSTWTSWPA